MGGRQPLAARAEALLARHWWRSERTPLAQALRPLSWLVRTAAAWQRWRTRPQAVCRPVPPQAVCRPAPPQAVSVPVPPQAAPVPVIVVGNLIVGGAGKTPTVIALVEALAAAGWRPGVISRGFGRAGNTVQAVHATSDARAVGDEPLLIRRRTGAPVWVGRRRVEAARALCAQHQEVNVLVSDDGLQHHALARSAELLVFDERGVGNGLLLPAGPLRQPVPRRLPPRTHVLYLGGRASTALPGTLALRSINQAQPLAAWWAGDETRALPLARLRGRPLLAVAGLAAPEKFFTMLEAAGLSIRRLAMPDHARYETLPWGAGGPEIITTEKDAVKLRPERTGEAPIWVVRLDFALPAALLLDLTALLRGATPP